MRPPSKYCPVLYQQTEFAMFTYVISRRMAKEEISTTVPSRYHFALRHSRYEPLKEEGIYKFTILAADRKEIIYVCYEPHSGHPFYCFYLSSSEGEYNIDPFSISKQLMRNIMAVQVHTQYDNW